MKIKFNKNLGKKEISDNIKSVLGFSSKNILKLTDDIIETIIQVLINNGKINIKNFGTFITLYKNERMGRNPKTREKFIIKQRKTIIFKPSNNLKQKINEI